MREFDASYIMRIWKDGKGDDAWRASLKELKGSDVSFFKSIDELLAFINEAHTVTENSCK